jgi:cellulose synthase (UDP-forming)
MNDRLRLAGPSISSTTHAGNAPVRAGLERPGGATVKEVSLRPSVSTATTEETAPRQPSLTLPPAPNDNEKYSYVDRNLPYLTITLAVSASCLIYSQLRFELHDPVALPFVVFTVTYILYHAISLPVNFTGRGFDLAAHQARVQDWCPARYPSVDIYLPICGEPIDMLRNTWTAVFELIAGYPGLAQAYVLDDGPSDEARSVSESFGFHYIRRPNLREYKKSGNLRYAFARTGGEYLVILDADFAPRSDFLAETLPYLDDPAIAIVQTPQFFRESPAQTWIENSAGAIQEVFYRSIQVSRDRFDAAICVGTSAVYRRAALEPEGGPTLIPYAEDVHTGLDVRKAGWSMVYLPIVLSTGSCPNNFDAFVRQQYRWCTGNAGIVFSRRLWTTPMSIPARLTYISGFFYYAYTGLLTFFGPILPIVLLAFLPGQVRLRNFVILGPAMVAGFVLYPLWHHSTYGPSVWPLGIARGWAHVFSIWDSATGKTMSWHPSRTPGSALRRFRMWVTAWSGGTALLWAVLAIWRTVTAGSAQFAVLVFFAMLNLAVVGRVIFPGGKTA